MKIVFLTQVLPYPLDAGPKLRAYYVLRQLAAQHEVLLVSFSRQEDRADHVEHLRQFCAGVYIVPMVRSARRTLCAVVTALAHKEPVIIARDRVAAMRRRIEDVFAAHGPVDAVHADQTSMVQYALGAADLQTPRPRLVLDAHNALHQVFRRLAEQAGNPLRRRLLAWEAERLAAYETERYAQFDEVVFVTEIDRARLDLSHAHVIPICVEPQVEAMCAVAAPTAQVKPRQVLFVGTLFWPPNAEGAAWFVREVWPLVLKQCPDARLVIAGKRPPISLLQLADAAQHVVVTGYVDDLTTLVAQSTLFIAPLHAGGGMRVKIVDAWNWGIPVLATTVGAEGLDCVAGEHLLIADAADAFAAAAVRLLDDPALAARLCEAGRRLVAHAYDWRRVYAAWDGVYAGALSFSPARAQQETLCN
ncbi:MAG: glycosyltransferase family 4 protein [Caldilinea sp.]